MARGGGGLEGGYKRVGRRSERGRCGCASGGDGRIWGERRGVRLFLRLTRPSLGASRGRSLRLRLAQREKGWNWVRGGLVVGVKVGWWE